MTFEEFERYQDELWNEVKGMADTKGMEYAHSKDRFANFNRLAEELKISNLTVAWIYIKKHLDSIASYVKDNKTYSVEPIKGRIVDAITYLTLIAGMIEEKEVLAQKFIDKCKAASEKAREDEKEVVKPFCFLASPEGYRCELSKGHAGFHKAFIGIKLATGEINWESEGV